MADFSTTVVTQVTQAVVLSTVQQVVQVNSAIPGNYLSAPRLGFGIFSVKDPIYGAVGDGVTDDTAAIQAALDDCSTAGGGEVYVPEGIYMISSPLTLPVLGRVTLAGCSKWQGGGSRATTLKLMPGANCNLIEVGAATQWCVRDMELRGQQSLQSGTSYGIYVSPTSNLSCALIENVGVFDFLTDGVYVGASQRSVFLNQCFISDNGGNGVNFAAASSDCKLTNSLVGLNGAYGVNIEGPANCVQGCDIYKNLRGVHLSSAKNSVVGCKIDTNDREAVVIDGVGVTVVGCNFDSNCLEANNTYATISVTDSRAAKEIVGCTFQNTNAATNLPTYHIALSAGTYRVAAPGNGFVAGTSVGGFSNAPERLDHGTPIYLDAVQVNPDVDGTRSLGSDIDSLGWRDLIIRQTVSEVRGLFLKQANAALTASPRFFLQGGSGVAWCVRVDNGVYQLLSGGVYDSTSGTERLNITTAGLFPGSALGMQLGSAAFPFGVEYVQRIFGAGTSHVAGDYVASANWGTGPTVAPVARDTGGRVSVTAQATTGANPTLALTFKDGSWTNPPAIACSRGDTVATAGYWVLSAITANVATFTFVGTPTAGQTYILDFVAMGK